MGRRRILRMGWSIPSASWRSVLLCAAAISLSIAAAPLSLAATTTRANVSSSGHQAAGHTGYPAVSADGRYVAFASGANNLVPGDTNWQWDIFVRDQATYSTERVSVSGGGEQANGPSEQPSLSAHGRYVAFRSYASNLVPGDTNSAADIFLYDRAARTVERVSVATGGGQANGDSDEPFISACGRYVVFVSDATNLVPGDTNGLPDVFIHDRVAGTTERVNVAEDGSQANGSAARRAWPSVSDGGRYVVFLSAATNLVAGHVGWVQDVFVRDRQTGTTRLVSVNTQGDQADGHSNSCQISADGRYVAFSSQATNLVPLDTNGLTDVFLRDLQAGTTERVSVGPGGAEANGPSKEPSISADGRYTVFASSATNLVAGDTNGWQDIFVYDRVAGTTDRVSLSSAGAESDGPSYEAVVDGVGRFVAFLSGAMNLVAGDTNGLADVFVRDRGGGAFGDMTRDGVVGFDDLAAFVAAWRDDRQGRPFDPAADFDRDGQVTAADCQVILHQLLAGAPP